MVELEVENAEQVDELTDTELSDDDELNLEDKADEMFDELNSVEVMVVEVIELDEDDDGTDEMVQLEIVVLGMINELEVEADLLGLI
jgi:hypothetical protein